MKKSVSFLSATVLGAAVMLSFSSASLANSNYTSYSSNSVRQSAGLGNNGYSNRTVRSGNFDPIGRGLIGDGSDTASFYYRVGVTQFEKGNLDKAERAFKAVLRANGLNKQANYYLVRINQKQGDEATAIEYAKAFHGLK